LRTQAQFRLLVVRLGAMGDILHALPAVTASTPTPITTPTPQTNTVPILPGNEPVLPPTTTSPTTFVPYQFDITTAYLPFPSHPSLNCADVGGCARDPETFCIPGD